MLVLIEHKDVRGLTGEFADNRAGPVFGGEVDDHDPVVRELLNSVYPGSLCMGAKELAKRRRTWWVRQGETAQMEACRFRFAGDEESMSFPWHTDFEDQCPIRWLVDFLNPAGSKDRRDFSKDLFNICRVEGHGQCRSRFVQGTDRFVLTAAHRIASTWNHQAMPFLSHGAISVTFPPVIPASPSDCTLRFGAKTRKRS